MSAPLPVTRDDQLLLNPLFILRWEDAQQAHILLYPEGMVRLNPTAGQILTECVARPHVGAMIDHLIDQYHDDSIAPDVLEFLAVAVEKGWLKRAL